LKDLGGFQGLSTIKKFKELQSLLGTLTTVHNTI